MNANNLDEPHASLRVLVAHVFMCEHALEGITYSELAERIGRLNKHGNGHGHGMGAVLGKMGRMLEDAEDAWGDIIPHIQSLVVNKRGKLRGLPDEGIKEFWRNYPDLTKLEKRNKSLAEYHKIREFGSRWNQVLARLNIPEIEAKKPAANGDETKPRGGGGESEAHLALKNYIASNPYIVGANGDDLTFTEYALPSLDTVDVLFKAANRWVAVEVKSRISDHLISDYERGLYQSVKYRAILEAMRSDGHYDVPDPIDVVLVLETSLPSKYQSLASSLKTRVIERINPSIELQH